MHECSPLAAIRYDLSQGPPLRILTCDRIQSGRHMFEREPQGIDQNARACVVGDQASCWVMLTRSIDGETPCQPVMPFAIPTGPALGEVRLCPERPNGIHGLATTRDSQDSGVVHLIFFFLVPTCFDDATDSS